jgi:hypothetical protein
MSNEMTPAAKKYELAEQQTRAAIDNQSEECSLHHELKAIRFYLQRAITNDDERSVLLFAEMARRLAVDHQRLSLCAGHSILLEAAQDMSHRLRERIVEAIRQTLEEELSPDDAKRIRQRLTARLITAMDDTVSRESAAQLNREHGVK